MITTGAPSKPGCVVPSIITGATQFAFPIASTAIPQIQAGKFRADVPGLQYIGVNFWKNPGIITLFDWDGNMLAQGEPIHTGSPMLPVNWRGDGQEFVLLSGNVNEGGMIDGHLRRVVMFPDDGHPDLAAVFSGVPYGIVAFFSVPLFVAVITMRFSLLKLASDPPLALVMLTTNWRLAGIRSSKAASTTAVMSGPGRLNL